LSLILVIDNSAHAATAFAKNTKNERTLIRGIPHKKKYTKMLNRNRYLNVKSMLPIGNSGHERLNLIPIVYGDYYYCYYYYYSCY